MKNGTLLQADQIAEIKVHRLYSVLLWNSAHKFDDVCAIVRTAFPHLSWGYVFAIVLTAHRRGVSACERRLSFEVAEYRRDLLQAYGLTATIESTD